MDSLYNDLLKELECPVCTNYMSPPIKQCATGHSICNTCKQLLTKCPLCQGPFTNGKNISLESLARKVRYPCFYESIGCSAKLAFDKRESHEINCVYRNYKSTAARRLRESCESEAQANRAANNNTWSYQGTESAASRERRSYDSRRSDDYEPINEHRNCQQRTNDNRDHENMGMYQY